jgi:hypothetical protein
MSKKKGEQEKRFEKKFLELQARIKFTPENPISNLRVFKIGTNSHLFSFFCPDNSNEGNII